MQITKQFRFEASHILPRHAGKCRHLHGHSWILEVSLEGPQSPESQFVLDYGWLKRIVSPLVEVFDHHHLNDVMLYPSSENVCQWVALYLGSLLNHGFSRLVVRVSETENTWSIWDSCQDSLADTGEIARPEQSMFDDPSLLLQFEETQALVDVLAPRITATIQAATGSAHSPERKS